MLDLADKINIENSVTISMRTTLITHVDFGHSAAMKLGYKNDHSPIVIENGVYIGAGVTILHGLRLGTNSIIAAGSVVNKDIPSNVVAAGVPARIIRRFK